MEEKLGVSDKRPLAVIMDMYEMMRLGKSFGEIRRAADQKIANKLEGII